MSENPCLRTANLDDVIRGYRKIGVPEWYVMRTIYALRELYYAEERLRRTP